MPAVGDHAAPLLFAQAGTAGPAAQLAGAHGTAAAEPTVVVLLADMAPGHTAWGWSRLVLQALPLRRLPGLRFAKVLGSGHAGGFGLRPSRTRQGLFLVFDSPAQALHFAGQSAVVAGYRAHCAELLLAVLQACSSRGSWSGVPLPALAAAPVQGPVAALTRASIRPLKARQFWRLQPAAEAALHSAPGCLLAAGVGEAPVLRQATFTVWQDAAALEAYARSGAHGHAARAAYAGGFFSETMFVRFAPLLLQGRWRGVQHGWPQGAPGG